MAKGSVTVNVLPTPSVLLTSISPWCSLTNRCTTDKPRPLPLSFRLIYTTTIIHHVHQHTLDIEEGRLAIETQVHVSVARSDTQLAPADLFDGGDGVQNQVQEDLVEFLLVSVD